MLWPGHGLEAENHSEASGAHPPYYGAHRIWPTSPQQPRKHTGTRKEGQPIWAQAFWARGPGGALSLGSPRDFMAQVRVPPSAHGWPHLEVGRAVAERFRFGGRKPLRPLRGAEPLLKTAGDLANFTTTATATY